ncbi:MAG: glyoxalase family protein [Solirubrobacteraceae bacterium]|jgi:glyoxalase family protein|nr:glyoxalase family protein [Solirubrobacteraceae bacterium]
MNLDGIHHITAITGDAPRNVDFYTRVLGLRMTAKTVNQDDPSVYHLFYGDENAQPGADLTFFEYPGAIPGRAGAGMVHRIVWRVASSDAIDFWAARLGDEGVATERDGDSLRFADPEGLDHELVVDGTGDEPLVAEHPEIPAALALRGFEGVRAYSMRPGDSATVLERLMGAVRRGGEAGAGDGDGDGDGEESATFELRGERRGGWIAWDPAPVPRGRQSAGTVHHIAWATTDADMPTWIDTVTAAGIPNSGYVDRHYFHSLYFREPGGVLYELATREPGFTVDGPVEELGTKLILPPFLEPRRAEIAARLTPLPDPRADRVKRDAAATGA